MSIKRSLHDVQNGYWGLVVVIAAFSIQFLTFGTTQSIGVYNVEFTQDFVDATSAAVSLVGSISLGVVLGTGPVSSLLLTKWSHRQVALFGACLCNIGLIAMPFAPNLGFMYAFYGVIAGFGYCLVYVPSHVLCGLYFKKHRSLATGIVTAGSGTGAAIFPIIIYSLVEHFSWRGSFYIVTGLNLHLFVFAALLRPLPEHLLESEENNEAKTLSIEENFKFDVHHSPQPLPEHLLESEENNEAKTLSIEENCKFDVHRSPHEYRGNESVSNHVVQERILAVSETGEERNPLHSESLSLVQKKKLGSSIKETLRRHFTAVFKVDFIIFLLSNVLWNAGGAIFLIFIAEYAHSVGLNKADSSKCLTLEGVGACFGCVLGGFLGNIKCINRIMLYSLGNIGGGAMALLIPWHVMHLVSGFYTVSLILGICFGVIMGLLVVVTSDLLGTEALSDGFGYVMFANGIGVFGGPPLAGLLMDKHGNKDVGFYLSGILSAAGGIVMLSVFLKRKLFHPNHDETTT